MADAVTMDLMSLAEDLSYASGKGIGVAANEVIRAAAQSIQQQAQAIAPVKTGKLRDSIQVRYPDTFKAIIGPGVAYGVYQEFGTGTRGEFPKGPYEIRPKKGKYLVFTIGGKKVFARVVHHPGIPARPYMRPGALNALGSLAGDLAERGALLITEGKR